MPVTTSLKSVVFASHKHPKGLDEVVLGICGKVQAKQEYFSAAETLCGSGIHYRQDRNDVLKNLICLCMRPAVW